MSGDIIRIDKKQRSEKKGATVLSLEKTFSHASDPGEQIDEG
jgi:hypothetical protein